MDFLRRFWTQAREMWAGFSRFRQAMVILSAIVAIGTFLGIAYTYNWFSATDKFPIPVQIPRDQTDKAYKKLTTEGITSAQIQSDGSIRVSKDDLGRAVVALTAEGFSLTSGSGPGYELFDGTTFGMTPFVQNVNYLRALQAELSRSIGTLEPVASARVLIAKPDPTPFVREQKPTTASVVLRLKPNAVVSRGLAAGIVSLVARSVDGLLPENVTVLDSNGRLVSDPNAAERGDLPTGQIDYRKDLEAYLAGKAEEMLARHLGAGRAVVRVSADINFQKVKEQRVTYSPDDKVVSAERLTTTKSTAPAARGVAGAASNISRAGGVPSGGASGESKEEVVQTDYVVSKTTRELEDKMGAVTRLTIAALTDLSPAEGTAPISRDEVEKIIKQAVGYKASRGDEIQVSDARLGVPVPPIPEIDEEAARIARLQQYVSLARNICLGLAVVTTAGLATLLIVRRARPVDLTPAPAGETPAPAAPIVSDELRERYATLAKTDPERIAAVIALMLDDATAKGTP